MQEIVSSATRNAILESTFKIKRDFAMKKKQEKRIVEKPATLGDLLNKDLVNELKEKKKELENQEAQKVQAQEEKKREERRLKEKNKSFEELLNESEFNWKDFK
jgi:FtsZ-binding cell division protein ZapB